MTNFSEQDELAVRQKLKDDFIFYAKNCLKVSTKSGGVVNLQLNKAQLYIHSMIEQQLKEIAKVRIIILKGRQQGCSSLIAARFFWKVTHNRGANVFILTHEANATTHLFNMSKRYFDNCPAQLKPGIKASNAKELIFSELDSGYKLGTAGNKSAGRSSTIQFLHASEAAFYKHADEHAKGIMQTIAYENGTEVIIESTANGTGNWFYQQWQQAEAKESDFRAIFVPWFWQDEYSKEVSHDFQLTDVEAQLKSAYNLSNEQLSWRRMKITELSVNGQNGEKSFQQEYPCNAQEAFLLTGDDHFIDPELVLRARKAQNVEAFGPKIIGVDPARFGDDRTAIVRRIGRKAYNLQTYIKKDTMQVANIVHQIIEEEKPDLVCIDVGGLGAGVVDRLHELGHKNIVVAVNSGSKPIDANKYYNKRAEMWGLGKKWLEEFPCSLPDSDELHADICNVKSRPDSLLRLLMEKKEDMKRRGIRSSDCADAWLLTFAMPNSFFSNKSNQAATEVAQKMRSTYNTINRIKNNRY